MLSLQHGNASVAFGCTDQECNIEAISDEDDTPSKSSKDKKSNGPDSGKASNLIFKITSKVPYKTVMKGNYSSNLYTIFFQKKLCIFLYPSQICP